MAVAVEQKNTFLGLVPCEEIVESSSSAKRSCSVPPTWKPESVVSRKDKLWSDIMSVSTEAPDDLASECGSEETTLTRTPLTTCSGCSKTRLRLTSRSFAPPSVSAVGRVIQYVQLILQNLNCVEDVYVTKGEDGVTRIAVTVGAGKANSEGISSIAWVLQAAQQAFLSAAENSQNVFVLGYAAAPFKVLSPWSLSTSLCIVPAGGEAEACWDAYQYGHCRRASCCKQHPKAFEMSKVLLEVSESVVAPADFPTLGAKR